MTNPTSNTCFASNSAATFAADVLSWSLRLQHRTLERAKMIADPMLILILSDINMPGMSGLEMLPKVKAARSNVPVIMITAYGDEATKKKAAELGAAGLLTKPIDFGLLREEIDQRLQQAA
jgi:DNA-binding response OmpR family regulator